MESPTLDILLIEDDEDDYWIVRQFFSMVRSARFQLTWAPTYDEGLRQFEAKRFSAILVDYSLGGQTGLDFIEEANARGCQAPIILLTGQGNYDVDVQAMRAGASDYLTKSDVSGPLLERSIRYAMERKEIEVRLRKDAERAALLAALSKDFAEAGLNTHVLVTRIAGRISEVTRDAIIVRMLGEDDGLLHPVAAYHPEPKARELLLETLSAYPLRVGEGLAGQVAAEQAPALVCAGSPQDLATHTHPAFLPWLERYPLDCMYAAPLCQHEQPIGTLSVLRARGAGPFSPEDQAFYLDLADRAAMAIENARLHQQVERLAVTDALTGVLNRRGFFQMGEREIERFQRYGHPLAMIMLDIDYFKTVNDTYGHAFGDEVLKELTQTCTAHIRKMDISARYGGDEFIILLPDTEIDTANRVADRIRACFSEKIFDTDSGPINISTSLGVASAEEKVQHLDDLIKRADQALYAAKQNGRNRVEAR